jgi:hypothetical protein
VFDETFLPMGHPPFPLAPRAFAFKGGASYPVRYPGKLPASSRPSKHLI